MQGSKKKTGGGSAQSVGEASARSAVKDAGAARMLAMGKSLGNDELKRRIDMGNASRDELLAHIAQRLGSMRQAQLREEDFGKNDMRSAWKEISDKHKEDITQPEPMRWRESAKIYEEAAYQLCRGSLGRGAQLMEKAMEAERKAFESVGKQIGVKDLGPEEEGPEAMGDVKEGQACTPTDVPSEISELADKIQNNNTEFKDQMNKKRKPDPWWTLEEEEEEEASPGEAG